MEIGKKQKYSIVNNDRYEDRINQCCDKEEENGGKTVTFY